MNGYRDANLPEPAFPTPAEPAKWIDDPHDIEQGQMLNPAWLKFHGLTAKEARALHNAGAEPAQQDRKGRWNAYELDEAEAAMLRDFIGSMDGDGEASAITLWSGDGHSGHGLYVSLTEYPEEGAVQLIGTQQYSPVPAEPLLTGVEAMEVIDAPQGSSRAVAFNQGARWMHNRMTAAPQSPSVQQAAATEPKALAELREAVKALDRALRPVWQQSDPAVKYASICAMEILQGKLAALAAAQKGE
jgi:hypothetical protein